MSRLTGRLVFPEDNKDVSSTSTDREEFSGGKGRGRGRGGPRGNGRGGRGGGGYRNAPDREDYNDYQDNPRPSYQGGKPRGRGPNYGKPELSERLERPERSNRGELYQPPKRFENRTERVDYQRQENPQQPPESSAPRKHTSKVEDVEDSEELLDYEDFIAQISDLTVRSDRSAAQIKRNILCSTELLETMEEDEWQKVCESMMTTALEQGEPEFISDLIVSLFQSEMFNAVMSDELVAASSQHVIDGDGRPLPSFLSAILCAHWPRHLAKAFDNVNPILYNVVCVIKGWILVVNEDTERYHKEEKKPTYQTREDLQEAQEKGEDVEAEDEEERIIEDPKVVNQCALALSDLCDTAQRQLWINWMNVTDEIYQCIKPAITHNPNISGDVKARLLDTFMQINQWTKTRKAAVKHVSTQTVASTTTSSE